MYITEKTDYELLNKARKTKDNIRKNKAIKHLCLRDS